MWGRIFSGRRARPRKRGFDQRDCRLLRIDALEARCLLSVTPADLSALIVSQTFGATQTTSTAHSVASDNAGDFVVAWTRDSTVTGSNGTAYQVNNVYARYFTDTVEQVSLPGPGTYNNNNQYLSNGIATSIGTGQPTFSLAYNDETVNQISVTAGTAPAGNVVAADNEEVAGTFTLWYDANGNGMVDPGETLVVNYDEADPTAGTQQIQTWLNSFTPVAANPTTGFAGSDATQATVNVLNPQTFVVNFGPNTQGLNQSNLLQYLSPSATTLVSNAEQQVTFTPNATVVGPVTGNFELQVGTVVTQPIAFDSTSALTLATTAANMETALQDAGFTTATVTVQPTVGATGYTFDITFAASEPAVQYVPVASTFPATFTNLAVVAEATQTLTFDATGNVPFTGQFQLSVGTVDTAQINFNSANLQTTAANIQAALIAAGYRRTTVAPVLPQTIPTEFSFTVTFTAAEQPVAMVAATPMPVTFTNAAAAAFTLTGYLPAVQVTTLDQPFVVNDIPVSQTNPELTAEAIEGAFEQQVDEYNTGVAPLSFPTPNRIGIADDGEAPYTAPVATQVGTNGVDAPATGWNPTITVQPVVLPSGQLSYTEFDITFTGVSGATVAGPMAVTNCVNGSGVGIGTTTFNTAGTAGTADVPTGSSEASVQILKESGNEFQVNPTQATSIFTSNQQPLSSAQPSVAMDGSGEFVISWTGGVSPELAPKAMTNIYLRMYAPVGITGSFSDAAVPGAVTSDLVTAAEETTDPALYAAQSYTGVRLLPNPNPVEEPFDISDPYTVQVGANYTNPQFDSAVAMDPYGNFVVVWANQGPDVSYFNNITMQRFDKNGELVGNEVEVNNEVTNIEYDPDVAMGADDKVVVSWSDTQDPSYLINQNAASNVYVRGFSPQEAPLWNELLVGVGAFSTVNMDGQDNFIASWENDTDPDVNGQVSEGVYATEYQLENYATGAALAAPAVIRATFRVNSASTNLATQTVWPFQQTAGDVVMDINGDIVGTYQGNGPAVSDNIDIPASFFQSYFALQQQEITFTSSTTAAPSGSFELQVGTVTTVPITFGTTPAVTATNIQTALVDAGFTGLTVASIATASPTVEEFNVTFGPGAEQLPIELAPASSVTPLPSSVTVTNSVNAPAVVQTLTFNVSGNTPVAGTFYLQVGTGTTAIMTGPIAFDSTQLVATTDNIQAALEVAGFDGVGVTATETATQTQFTVTFLGLEPVIYYVAAANLPSTVTFSQANTVAERNADLLPYFDPFPNVVGGVTQAGDTLPGNASDELLYDGGNFNVDTAIDQVLFNAEYPLLGSTTPAATLEQIGRLRAILENVAGLLRGESDGVMASFWDAAAQYNHSATFSDDIISTQRAGQDQRYYIEIPNTVEQGTFTLQIGFGDSPNADDVQANVVNTAAITIPGTGEFGAIDDGTTELNIATAIDNVLGEIWPGVIPEAGAVNVRS